MQDILKGIAYLRKKKPSEYNYADLLFLGRFLDKVENYITGKQDKDFEAAKKEFESPFE